jgi:predicted Zn finger-like uncharacterized protein
METQCPHCKTVFRVDIEQLKPSNGRVVCGNCDNEFNANEHLLELKPAPTKSVADMSDEELAAVIDEHDTNKSGSSILGLIFWMLISVLLAFTLSAQYIWWQNRDFVLQHTEFRPILEQTCQLISKVMPCILPQTQNLSKLKVLEHTATAVDQTDIIEFNLLFANQADFPQIFPKLRLTFLNDSGKIIAQRIFTPNEYLKQNVAGKTINPGANIHLRLELLDQYDLITDTNRVSESYKFDFVP